MVYLADDDTTDAYCFKWSGHNDFVFVKSDSNVESFFGLRALTLQFICSAFLLVRFCLIEEIGFFSNRIFFSFLMASIMSKAVVGSVIALIFYILSFMPYMFVFTSGMSTSFWPILVTVSSP